jgi:hypothetical protein
MRKGSTLRNTQVLLGITILGTTLAGACSGNSTAPQSNAGAGGNSSAAPGTGGNGSSNPGGAGHSGNGGIVVSGGSLATGGAIVVGGTTGDNTISSGGGVAPGGVADTGGVANPGGSTSGTTGTGGTTGGKGGTGGAEGGATGTGGAKGGTPGSGGATGATGGAKGGTPATGGATGATGGAKGGTPATGGATGSTGGAKGGSGAGGSSIPSGPAVAFPGALGFGKKATGGRGYPVYHVTNLNDTGAGSFRDAVSAGKRIVVFDVGGYVLLTTAVSASSDLTIAGQTAPGDGIGFQGFEVSFNAASNVIVRYVRFRQGLIDPNWRKSGINLLNGSNMIFDHVSIEFAQYNNIDAVGASNITMQYSINADPTHQQFGAHTEGGGFFTWYANLWANAHGRLPLAKANTQFVNNVAYNYQYAYCAGDTGGSNWHDIIDNYFIAGPSTNAPGDDFYQMNAGQTVYVSGNLLDSNADGTLNGTDAGQPGGTTKASKANSTDTASLPTTSAAAAYADVLANAGCWPQHRDQVDSLVIADVKSLGKSGKLWTDQNATGLTNQGYGTLAGGTAPVDTDKDGMPDAWETKYGLNPNDPSDATGDFDKTGYTNIEKYINGLVDGLYP